MMSALGHKETSALREGMSALPPKADICCALAAVRQVLIGYARIARRKTKLIQRNNSN
jgi:hypothetical protein